MQIYDIHTHKIYDDGTIFLFSRGLWRDSEPPRGTLFSAGIHPWSAQEADIDAAIDYLETAPIAAIGEIGLDYASDVPHGIQLEVFERQLQVAVKRGLPVVIHCIRAFYDVLSTLKLYTLKAVIFHGYIGSPEQSAELLKNGYYASFNMRSLASPKTIESLRQMPLNAIFAETDDEQEHVSTVYDGIAEARSESIEVLKAALQGNFNRIFQ